MTSANFLLNNSNYTHSCLLINLNATVSCALSASDSCSRLAATNNTVESLVNKYNAKIIEVNVLYTVIEKTGGKAEIQQLFEELEAFGILQFVRSGSVSITRSKYEQLSDVTMC